MESPVDIIKERLSIVDVLSSYITLTESGKNYKARCPFHNEKTPSFYVSPDRNSYYCFGCGAKGDIFSFVEHFEGTDFLGSLKLLAQRAGVELSNHKNKISGDEKELSYEIMEEATKFFEMNFSTFPDARAYLLGRGISDATIKLFRIGYAKDEWRTLLEYLTKKGYKKENLEKVGLIKSKDSNSYDRFRSRIMFPISDSSGRVIAFSGRIFGSSQNMHKSEIEPAKYLNSPDTILFNKSNVLFGIDKAKLAIRTRGYTIVVEGQMDLILSHQAGFPNTVAVSGTAFTDNIEDNESKINNLGLIRRLSPNVIFAFDGDSAGIRATNRAAMIALSLDMQVKVAVLPSGKDPADIILENSDKWKDIIKNSTNIITFHIARICNETGDIRQRGKKIREVIFPFLLMVKSAIERSAYITEIHNSTGIAEGAIISDFENYENNHGLSVSKEIHITPKAEEQSRKSKLESELFGIIFLHEQGGIQNKEITQMLDSLKEIFPDLDNLREVYEPFKDTLAYKTEMWYGNKIETLGRDTKEIILNLEEEVLHERKVLLQPVDTEEKLNEFNNISRRIEEIKQARYL